MIYHVLPEAEHFSEFRGGAISRWAAKVLEEESEANILCSSADPTWNFAPGRIHLAQNLHRYLSFRARRFYPPQVSLRLSQEAVAAFTQCFRWTAVRKAYRSIAAEILQSVPVGVA